MTTPTTLTVHAIDPARLAAVRAAGSDGHGNDLHPFAATGEGEPLRCCLRYAEAGEALTLISFAPFDHPSVWTEVGPVYVHVEPCGGPDATDRLPPALSHGPKVLRTYRADDTLAYEHIVVVTDDADLTPVVTRLLAEPAVATVHVRTLGPGCFLFAVTR